MGIQLLDLRCYRPERERKLGRHLCISPGFLPRQTGDLHGSSDQQVNEPIEIGIR